jgi:hypothetical protein
MSAMTGRTCAGRCASWPRELGGALLMVGRDVRPIVDLRGRMVEILVLSGLFVAPLLLAAGFAVSLGPLRRVDRLQRVALEIGSAGWRRGCRSRGAAMNSTCLPEP